MVVSVVKLGALSALTPERPEMIRTCLRQIRYTEDSRSESDVLAKVDIEVAGARKVFAAGVLGVAQAAVEAGCLEGKRPDQNLDTATALSLALGRRHEFTSKAAAALVITDPKQLDARTLCPRPATQAACHFANVVEGADAQALLVVLTCRGDVEGSQLGRETNVQVRIRSADAQPAACPRHTATLPCGRAGGNHFRRWRAKTDRAGRGIM